jgi:hypothetical protein
MVGAFLPGSIAFNTDFDTSENHLFSTSEVYAELDNISILHRIQSRLGVWLAEPNVVQKGP